jgi:hypothetical protein
LSRLDFIRGDRVAFVTFDHTAYIIDPDGTAGPQQGMIETEHDLQVDANPAIDASIGERHGATEVLRSLVGVRAEPSYYGMGTNGQWAGLLDWDPTAGSGGAFVPEDWSHYWNTAIGSIYLQPSTSSCFYDRAILGYPQAPASIINRPGGPTGQPRLLLEANSVPGWYTGPNAHDLASAEYRGGCGSGNIGSALGQSQNAFIQGGRTEGAVWIMVLLSDGAAGVTDPVVRNFIDKSVDPMTYNSIQPNPFNQVPVQWNPTAGDYGAEGVCPYGSDMANLGELLNTNDYQFPYCSDKAPETRHFCSALPMPPTEHELDNPACNEAFYDTDDYARDWADWVAMADLPVDPRSSIERATNEQLPTIFTIGIGLDYARTNPFNGAPDGCASDTDWACRTSRAWTYEEYLGTQLLRYIGDLGDNFRLDDDYWQCYMEDRIPNVVDLDPTSGTRNCGDKTIPEWGLRGPCEEQDVFPSQRGDWLPLAPTESCGNYFAAATANDLERVFSVIASRMFTRLSQ